MLASEEELFYGAASNESLQNSEIATNSLVDNPSSSNDHTASSSPTARLNTNPPQAPLNEDEIQPSSPTSDTFPNQDVTQSDSSGAPLTDSSLNTTDGIPDIATSQTSLLTPHSSASESERTPLFLVGTSEPPEKSGSSPRATSSPSSSIKSDPCVSCLGPSHSKISISSDVAQESSQSTSNAPHNSQSQLSSNSGDDTSRLNEGNVAPAI